MQRILKDKKTLLIIVISVFLVGGALWFYFFNSNDTMIMIDESNGNVMEEEDDSQESSPIEEESQIEEPPKEIMVHIVGQVNNPGVITLQEGARLIDAIDLLGGPTEEAELEGVNLAQKLRDEEKIYIPKIGESITQETSSNNTNNYQEPDDEKININTANQQQLKTLSGIGDVLSEKIIEYREANGGFKSIEEIKEVSRIGDKIFNDIKEKIKI